MAVEAWKITPIGYESIRGDVMDIDAPARFSVQDLDAERDYWETLIADGDFPPHNTELAQVMGGCMVDAASSAAALAALGDIDALSASFRAKGRRIVRHMNAKHALSKLLRLSDAIHFAGGLRDHTSRLADNDEPPEFFVDLDTVLGGDADACVVLMRKALFLSEGFMGNPDHRILNDGWYITSPESLYLHVNTPAPVETTRFLYHSLINSTGSAKRAEALIDRERSLTIRPYLSRAWLRQA